ncbi:MAG: hypothetical protein JWM85_1104 [Acidimicrobiaceae bacterium]|nr:hypothetical protein [Acidimicrobiaceae bacterium]
MTSGAITLRRRVGCRKPGYDAHQRRMVTGTRPCLRPNGGDLRTPQFADSGAASQPQLTVVRCAAPRRSGWGGPVRVSRNSAGPTYESMISLPSFGGRSSKRSDSGRQIVTIEQFCGPDTAG